jgi:Flp pilus assembly protein TadB
MSRAIYSEIQDKKCCSRKRKQPRKGEDLKALEAESSRLAIHKKTYADAADELKKEERELSSLPDTAVKGLGGKGGAALASFALALACFAVTLAISIWLILIPAAVLCITGGLLLFLRARDLAEKRAEFKAARELLEYK